jgi:hypothetical protein
MDSSKVYRFYVPRTADRGEQGDYVYTKQGKADVRRIG